MAQTEISNGVSIRSIARHLDPSPSTPSWKLGRQEGVGYVAKLACQRRRLRCKSSVRRCRIVYLEFLLGILKGMRGCDGADGLLRPEKALSLGRRIGLARAERALAGF